MEFLNLSRMTAAKKIFLATLAVSLLAFVIFIEFVATKAQLKFIGAHHLDKIAHFSGGLFLSALAETMTRPVRLVRLLVIIGAAAVGWEAFEFLFDQDVSYFFAVSPDLWRLDTLGDITAAFLGGYGWWVFGRERKPGVMKT